MCAQRIHILYEQSAIVYNNMESSVCNLVGMKKARIPCKVLFLVYIPLAIKTLNSACKLNELFQTCDFKGDRSFQKTAFESGH